MNTIERNGSLYRTCENSIELEKAFSFFFEEVNCLFFVFSVRFHLSFAERFRLLESHESALEFVEGEKKKKKKKNCRVFHATICTYRRQQTRNTRRIRSRPAPLHRAPNRQTEQRASASTKQKETTSRKCCANVRLKKKKIQNKKKQTCGKKNEQHEFAT